MIKALAALKERITNIKLVLVGTSTEQDILDELVREDSLEEYVSFEGWQDVSLFPSYIKTANVCLSPLVRNLHHDTTYANKLFQYMAMGKPVIVSDCPAQARVVRESNCGLIFKADDLDNFIEKILTLYESPDKAQMMGKNGEEAVFNKWNWNQTSKGLIHLYETLL